MGCGLAALVVLDVAPLLVLSPDARACLDSVALVFWSPTVALGCCLVLRLV